MNNVTSSQNDRYNLSQAELLEGFISLQKALQPLPLRQPGKIAAFGWDIEYVSGPALLANLQYQVIKRMNDFYPDHDDPVILDLGANIGLSVLHYKRQIPNARIIAFEPDPVFLPILQRNLAQNGATDVQVIEAAAWISDGEAPWVVEGIDGSRLVDVPENHDNIVTVRTVDLASFLEQDVDLIKMDIEGAEHQVISHLANKLGNVKNLSIECHLMPGSYSDFAKLIEILEMEGFQITINSYGVWQDLIRVSEIPPYHFKQYILISGCRTRDRISQPSWGIPPNADFSSILQVMDLTNRLSHSEQQFQTLNASYVDLQAQNRALKTEHQHLQDRFQESQALIHYLQQPLYRRVLKKLKRMLNRRQV